MFVVSEHFLSSIVDEYREDTHSFHRLWWYMVSTASLLIFETKSSYYSFVYKNEKSINDMTMRYIKDGTERI